MSPAVAPFSDRSDFHALRMQRRHDEIIVVVAIISLVVELISNSHEHTRHYVVRIVHGPYVHMVGS